MSHHVLVADDDPHIREALERSLRFEGFVVNTVSNGKLAVREIEKNMPALLILDISMPEMDGIEVTKYLRSIGTDIPICVLSAHDQVSDRVLGLEVGADDYLIKPFAFEELVARVKALLRRQVESSTRSVSVSELSVDPLTRTASYFDMSLDLTKKEFDLLYALAINASIVVTRDQLLDRVWGYDFEVNTNVVDVFVGYLRRKMEVNGSPRMIETVRGVGFVLKK